MVNKMEDFINKKDHSQLSDIKSEIAMLKKQMADCIKQYNQQYTTKPTQTTTHVAEEKKK